MLFLLLLSSHVTLTVYVPGIVSLGIVQRISHLKSAVGTQLLLSPILSSPFILIDYFH